MKNRDHPNEICVGSIDPYVVYYRFNEKPIFLYKPTSYFQSHFNSPCNLFIFIEVTKKEF